MSAQYYFGDDSDVEADILSNDALPFPKPLDRDSFLAPNFSAADFLSSLSDRFQTLEDLQAELQQLLQSLNKDLVDLVNDNYQHFLSLGSTLSGGEERIEEVRVGLLGFQRDVTGLRDSITKRSEDISKLIEEKKSLRKRIGLGRTLLTIAERIEDLEIRLSISQPVRAPVVSSQNDVDYQPGVFKEWSADWDHDSLSDASDGEDESSLEVENAIPRSIRRKVEQFLAIKVLETRVGSQHPFLLGQRARMEKIRTTIGRELEVAARAESQVKRKQAIIQLKSRLDND